MIELVTQEVFENTQGVSYSRLSKFAESPQAYKASLAEDAESSAISLGSAVDVMLTEPEEEFDKRIYVMTKEKPGAEMMLKYVNAYFATGDKEKAYIASGYKITQDAVEKKFSSEGKDYYDALIEAGDRKILDVEGMFKANQIVNLLRENPFTKKYFIPEDGTELLFQSRIIWRLPFKSLLSEREFISTPAKSIVDIIRIDHRNKLIQPIELKTGEDSFMKSYWRFKRYLQGAMYTTAVEESFHAHDAFGSVSESDYKIENLRFIYADTNLQYGPMIYKMTDNDVDVGIHGIQYKSFFDSGIGFIEDKWKVKGYRQLAAELDWHQKNDMWDYSYDVYKNNGEVDIDAFVFKF